MWGWFGEVQGLGVGAQFLEGELRKRGGIRHALTVEMHAFAYDVVLLILAILSSNFALLSYMNSLLRILL